MSGAQRNWFQHAASFLFVILSTVAILEVIATIQKGDIASKLIHAPAAAITSASTWPPASAFRRKMLQQAIQTVDVDSSGLPWPVHPVAPGTPLSSSSRPVQAIQTVELDLGPGTAGPVQAIQTLRIVSQPRGEQQKSRLPSPYEQPYVPRVAGDSAYSAAQGECTWHSLIFYSSSMTLIYWSDK